MAFLRPLGETGMMVSALGLGTVKLGRNEGVKYPAPFDLPADAEVAGLLSCAAELGINLIDTAPAYGSSEERLGAVMGANAWFGGRDRWIVSTKAGEEFAGGKSVFDFSGAAIQKSVERSLARLRTDRLDVVLLHSDGRDGWIAQHSGALAALERLSRAGKIRAYGISVKTVEPEAVTLIPKGRAVVMVTYNTAETDGARMIRIAADAGAGVLVKKALGSGHAMAAGARKSERGADPVEASLRFVFAEPGASSVMVGTINPAHLKHNVEAAKRAAG
jgi:aryl-alcohol dehydrogenase-like predicted oxidoreductase